jgi:lipid-A-disaccharide synthase
VYAGALVEQLRSIDPAVQVRGVGGPQFAAAGGELIADYRGLSATGFTAPIGKLGQTYGRLRTLLASARRDPPDALIAIDVPDFNFWLARGAKRLGIPIVYYVSPQIWAWRRGRLKTIKATADLMIVIFPFEESIYRDAGVPVVFVGHPLLDLVRRGDRDSFLAARGLSPRAPTVAILPGSRANEVARILPGLIAAGVRIRAKVPAAQFLVARAPDLGDVLFGPARSSALGPVTIVDGATDAVLSAADVVLTASGTATVQAAIHDAPMVIVYRLSAVEYWIARRLVKVDAVGMVNLIAGETIVPEFVQEAFTPEAVASEAIAFLTDGERRARAREGLALVRRRLGEPGASRRAAEAILQVVRRRRSA